MKNGGQLDKIKDQRVLAGLERRALRYRYGKRSMVTEEQKKVEDLVDETGTVVMAGLMTDESGEDGLEMKSACEV